MKIHITTGASLRNDTKTRQWLAKFQASWNLGWFMVLVAYCIFAHGTVYSTVPTAVFATVVLYELCFLGTKHIGAYYGDRGLSFGLGLFVGVADSLLVATWFATMTQSGQKFTVAFPNRLVALAAAYAFGMLATTACMLLGYRRDCQAWQAYNDTMLSETEEPLAFLEYCTMVDPESKGFREARPFRK